MRFSLDAGDVLGDGCWETVLRVLGVFSTLWMGVIITVMATGGAELAGALWSGAWGDIGEIILEIGKEIFWALLFAPLYFLLSIWGLLLVPLLAVIMMAFFRSESEMTWVWFSGVMVVALVAMIEGIGLPGEVLEIVAWVIFLLLCASLAAGCWLSRGWRSTSQAQHLMEVSAENERRRLEIEQTFGTKSFGQDNQTDYKDD